jgi:hypothetical protein
MSDWMIQILESKRDYRAKLAALPFAEKIVLLEQLRQRSLMIGSVRKPKSGVFPTAVHIDPHSGLLP